MHYKFILVDTANGTDQAHWILAPPVTVGRGSSAEVSIGDPSISRRHCQFTIDGQGALTVRDLGSLNGIYVEDRRVKKAVLKPGDLVQIGSITLRIDWTDDDIVQSPPFGKSCDVNVTQKMQTISRNSPNKSRS
jgi:hypothetical protein